MVSRSSSGSGKGTLGAAKVAFRDLTASLIEYLQSQNSASAKIEDKTYPEAILEREFTLEA